MMQEVAIHDNEFLRQFETKIEGGGLAKIEYSSQERKIFLTKLVIPEDLKGGEFQERFIKAVMHNIEERNLRVVPTSPEVAGFLRRHKEYKDLLPVGVRI